MKKLLFLTATALLALPFSLSAENPYIMKKGDKKPTEYKKIELDEKDSKSMLVTMESGAKSKVPLNQVEYAWIPKPESVAAADALVTAGDFQKAADAYIAAAAEYKLFGWDPYCRFESAKALKQGKQYDSAIKMFSAISKENFENPNDKKYTKEATLLLGETYLEAGKYSEALNFAQAQSKLEDDVLAGAAYLLRAKIYRMQANAEKADAEKQKALLTKAAYAYFGAALLFKDATTRPEALFNSWEILKELKDARAEEFAKILRAEYPDNPFTKRLQ